MITLPAWSVGRNGRGVSPPCARSTPKSCGIGSTTPGGAGSRGGSAVLGALPSSWLNGRCAPCRCTLKPCDEEVAACCSRGSGPGFDSTSPHVSRASPLPRRRCRPSSLCAGPGLASMSPQLRWDSPLPLFGGHACLLAGSGERSHRVWPHLSHVPRTPLCETSCGV